MDMEMELCVDGGFLLLRVVSCFEIGDAEVCEKEREVWMQILRERCHWGVRMATKYILSGGQFNLIWNDYMNLLPDYMRGTSTGILNGNEMSLKLLC